MIERKFIKDKISEYKVQNYLLKAFKNSSYSHSNIQKTPLGEKITVYSSRPGLIIGKGGSKIKGVVNHLKTDFGMKTPQIDVQEIAHQDLDANIIAENIASMMERNGVSRFKYIGHSTCKRIMNAGAIGVEVKISGRVPSKRTKTWKFLQGYLPKCGNPADEYVVKGYRVAMIKSGAVGITVKILLPNTKMPDDIEIIKVVKEEVPIAKEVEVKEVKKETVKEKKTEEKKEVKKEVVKEVKTEVKEEVPVTKEVKTEVKEEVVDVKVNAENVSKEVEK